jgi:hypothetical protein
MGIRKSMGKNKKSKSGRRRWPSSGRGPAQGGDGPWQESPAGHEVVGPWRSMGFRRVVLGWTGPRTPAARWPS